MEDMKSRLAQVGQEHLLNYWQLLNLDERNSLMSDLKAINYEEVASYFKACTTPNNNNDHCSDIDCDIGPLPASVIGSSGICGQAKTEEFKRQGLQLVADGRVGIILMAGGQGSRLGFSHPKGMYDVGLPSSKTLFQLQGERIAALQRLSVATSEQHDAPPLKTSPRSAIIPWYIMTSASTMAETKQYFADNSYFGLQSSQVSFFEQNSLPCMSFDGRIFLATPSTVAKAPDGNGGLYKALESSGAIDDMKRRGVQHLHAYCVDNILVKMADPVFIGFCASRKANVGAKVVKKTLPDEPVGVVCKVKDQYRVVEYSEISKETSEKRNEFGDLMFSSANIANHYFSTKFLEDVVSTHEKEMVHHVAKKKIAHVSLESFEDTKQIKPVTPNGIKMEKFVFDVFQFARSDNEFAIWEVDRESEFSPLKNADGNGILVKDSPTTVRNDLFNYHKKLVEKSGGICQSGNEEKEFICEISHSISYDGEGLEEYVSGQTFKSPLYLKSKNE